MEIKRNPELVEHYHFDFRLPEDKTETEMKVGFAPLKGKEDFPEADSLLGCRLNFKLAFERFVISGAISQINHLVDRKVEKQEDLTQEEINELALPLFKIVERLTLEVTEIATDRPGIRLNFFEGKSEQ
ncbi:DUF1149 family protein [Enterococcus timonensis]|uniref:DUF1149 family protein n=1 Tax=Enterococcus timonensis TaxID=1852364 RepID=UPI0008DB19CA|nr:DUF1149 family protein [Enterococcus timonensis]